MLAAYTHSKLVFGLSAITTILIKDQHSLPLFLVYKGFRDVLVTVENKKCTCRNFRRVNFSNDGSMNDANEINDFLGVEVP